MENGGSERHQDPGYWEKRRQMAEEFGRFLEEHKAMKPIFQDMLQERLGLDRAKLEMLWETLKEREDPASWWKRGDE